MNPPLAPWLQQQLRSLLAQRGSFVAAKFNQIGQHQPYGALLEEELGTGCVNLGVINAGLDLYLHDPALLMPAYDDGEGACAVVANFIVIILFPELAS